MLVSSQERKRTDTPAILVCIIFVVVLFGVITYTFFNGTIYRFIYGYDDCGNVCGLKNDGNPFKSCGNTDKTLLPYTLLNATQNTQAPSKFTTESSCVKSCKDFPGYIEVANRCLLKGSEDQIEENFFEKVAEDFRTSWFHILISVVVAMVFSYILLILFRYATKYVIWIIYIGIVILISIFSILALVMFFVMKSKGGKEEESAYTFLIVSVICAIVALIFGVMLYFFRKRIKLVIQLFKEASKALSDVPLIVVEPLLTFIALLFTFILFIYFTLIIQSSGTPKNIKNAEGYEKVMFEKDFVMEAAFYINFIAFFWFASFILGCQHFIIASTVCQWFFTRAKTELNSPIKRAFSHLLNFHIGSVCLGSIIITIARIIRMILESIINSAKKSENAVAKIAALCFSFIMEQLEQFLQYLVRNGYIIVALDGTPLFDSGKKAFELMKKNLVDVVALNQIGDFVLVLGRLFVVLISGFVCFELTMELNYPWIPITLAVIFSFLVVHCFMTVFEMTLDTIFICFCEDCELNDGMTRPFFMSREMMEVMIELKSAAGGEFDFLKKDDAEGGNVRPLIPQNFKFSD
ncbi:CLUMA_CG000582, isoform A [Clunio marinus]|uniref:Choline transporter-like protein n=1 Tax=Clunio marinus TaxID=568069 RepID=A0A1J1HJV3_9DIPT|nr:CLUMA_CG000582, isoform B [Clunio marinus]CRK86750.1 CLUMA_CG000582, isoform A [Clunio marinus]